MKAAICNEFKQPLVVEDVDIDSPGKGEVKIRMAATAICHSDIHLLSGDMIQELPTLAGHESAGYVEEVGGDVTSVEPGDHVALTTVYNCGKCKACYKGFPHMCNHRWSSDLIWSYSLPATYIDINTLAINVICFAKGKFAA